MENKNIEKYYYPMIVSSSFGREDAQEEIISRWDKFDTLSEEEKDAMISFETAAAIKNISLSLGFIMKDSAELARLVRDVFFGKVPKNSIATEIVKRIPSVSLENAKRIAFILNEKVFLRILKAEANKPNNIVDISLNEALGRYASTGELTIGSDQLMLKFFPTPVRPSIKNWISDYHDVLGAGKHSPIERGNYLFHGENGKRLSSVERQKLATVLKSLDEETPLKIDTEKQQIIFEDEAEEAKEKPMEKQHINISRKPMMVVNDLPVDQTNIGYPQIDHAQENKIQNSFLARDKQDFLQQKTSSANFVQSVAKQTPRPSTLPSNFAENFSQPAKQDETPKKNLSPNFATRQSVTFSSPQKLPVEQTAEQPIKEVSKVNNLYRIVPRNLVDLKENQE